MFLSGAAILFIVIIAVWIISNIENRLNDLESRIDELEGKGDIENYSDTEI